MSAEFPPIVVYKVKCKTTGKIYIGNTQQYFKSRMRGHFQDVNQIVEKNVYSDSYAKHFGGQVPKGASAPTPGMQRDLISSSILWKGDPLTAVKSFRWNSCCQLYNQERMAIDKACQHKDAKGLVNSRSELHGACRHIPRFHRLSIKAAPSADERKKRCWSIGVLLSLLGLGCYPRWWQRRGAWPVPSCMLERGT
jgi:hypothetical protein